MADLKHGDEELAEITDYVGGLGPSKDITSEPIYEIHNSGSWSFGPIEIRYSLAGDTIRFEAKLAGIRIGSGTLSAKNNQACVSAQVVLAKVKLCLTADFGAKELSVQGELCTRKFPSGWSCRQFRTRILAW